MLIESMLGDALDKKIIEIFRSYKGDASLAINEYIDSINNGNYFSSQDLARAIYHSGYLNELSILREDFFIKNYKHIFRYLESNGSSNSYIYLFKGLFGGNTRVHFNFDSEPGVINCSVYADLVDIGWCNELKEDVVTEANEDIIFSILFQELSVSDTECLLKLLIPHGIEANFDFQTVYKGKSIFSYFIHNKNTRRETNGNTH